MLRPAVRRRLFFAALLSLSGLLLWLLWPRPAVLVNSQPPDSDIEQWATYPVQPPSSSQTRPPGAAPGPEAVPGPDRIPQPQPIPKVRLHTVQEGESVSKIALLYGLENSSLLWSNGLTASSLLQVGQELRIPPVDGILYTVVSGDTMWEVSIEHGVEPAEAIRANPDLSPDSLQPGLVLLLPGAQPPGPAPASPQAKAAPAGGPLPAPAQPQVGAALTWPVEGPLTDTFGWRTHPVFGTPNFHEGIDIAVPVGTPVKAAAAGRVITADWFGGYGLTIRLDHGDGLVTRYSHNSDLLVARGDWVEAGQRLALSGNTGVSTGPHLDFGIYRSGRPLDPLTLLPER